MNSFWRSFGGQFARRRGTPGNSWWGSATRFFKSSPDFRPKKCNFPHPFSDKTSKIHTRFQIWPLGRNYVMITQIRAQTKKLFKSISNSHISLSFLLIWNWNDKYVHTLRSSLENNTRFQTKCAKGIPVFRPKRSKNHAWWGRHTHTYMAYIRENPPPPGTLDFKWPDLTGMIEGFFRV